MVTPTGWTALRLHSHAFMVWLAVLCLLVLGALVANRRNWLLLGTLLSASIALLGFALLNPDRFIAQQNLHRYTVGRPLDATHLTSLSADAAPVVLQAFDLAAAREDFPLRDALGGGLRRRLADLDCAAPAPGSPTTSPARKRTPRWRRDARRSRPSPTPIAAAGPAHVPALPTLP